MGGLSARHVTAPTPADASTYNSYVVMCFIVNLEQSTDLETTSLDQGFGYNLLY